MATTFLGRDNNGNPCYHVRKGNGLSVDQMKSGVQDDTLFHSSLPYLQVLDRITVGKSYALNNNPIYYDVFNFPSNLITYLNSKKLILASAVMTDGSRINISNIPRFSCMISEGLYDFGTSSIRPRFTAKLSMGSLNGFYFINSSVSTVSGALGDITYDTNGSGNYQDQVLNGSGGSGYNLQTTSRSCIYRSERLGAYNYLDVSYIDFIILNINSSFGSLNYSSINPNNSDIRIDSTGLYIGGSSILTGKGFLGVGSSNKYNGSYAPSNDFIGADKITLNNLGTLTIPYCSSLFYYSNPGVSVIAGFENSNGVLSCVNINGGTVTYKESWSSESRSSSRIDTFINKLSIDTFKISSIPYNNGCVFTKDNLKVNGVELYSVNNSNLITFNSNVDRFYIAPVSGITYSSVTDGQIDVLASFNVIKPNTTLGILYNLSHYGISNNVVCSGSGIGAPNNATFNLGNYANEDSLLGNMGILNVGDCIPLATINANMGVEISLMTAQGQYARDNNGIGITFMLYRVNQTTVQLIRRFSKFYFGSSKENTITVSTPGFYFNYIQMNTVSVI